MLNECCTVVDVLNAVHIYNCFVDENNILVLVHALYSIVNSVLVPCAQANA
jgi:hypothetical protein